MKLYNLLILLINEKMYILLIARCIFFLDTGVENSCKAYFPEEKVNGKKEQNMWINYNDKYYLLICNLHMTN